MSTLWNCAAAITSYLLGTSNPSLSSPSTSPASVTSVNTSPSHEIRKTAQPSITLLTGLGIERDMHMGETVQHLYNRSQTHEAVNLKQVHLMESESLGGLQKENCEDEVGPGELGEDITTVGIKLRELKTGALLEFHDAEEEDEERESDEFPGVEQEPPRVRIQGVRNPRGRMQTLEGGLGAQRLEKDTETFRTATKNMGVVGMVERGGVVRPGMKIVVVEEGEGELGIVEERKNAD